MTMHDYMHNKLPLTRKSWIAMLFAILFSSGIFGFLYETVFYIFNNGALTRRGTCFGPWIEIYCFGGLIIFLVCFKLRTHPWLVFLLSGAVCTVLEYAAGYALYTATGKRSWDYNTEILNFGNVDGFICLRSALVFAAAGLLLIYVVIPIQMKVYRTIGEKKFFVLMLTVGLICLADIVYNDALAPMLGTMDAVTFWGKTGIYPIVTGYLN